ncbi:MAG: DUF262 domain-containing protein [Polyangiaceae bacterium]
MDIFPGAFRWLTEGAAPFSRRRGLRRPHQISSTTRTQAENGAPYVAEADVEDPVHERAAAVFDGGERASLARHDRRVDSAPMSSPFLYRNVPEPLGNLLEQAGAGSAPATLLIPDLQRPYVWKPAEIIVLVDSLLRGWPFGSLLVWNYGQDKTQAVEMPHRRFWKEADRRQDFDSGTDVSPATLPAATPFRMVLDGQQRVQSLLLAVGGDDWGLKLTDRQWAESLTNVTLKGRKVANPTWTRGQLCLNVTAYLSASTDAMPRQVDYVPLLNWVNTLAAAGTSAGAKAGSKSALPAISAAPGEFVRLSRLWSLTKHPRHETRVSELQALLPSRKLDELLRLNDFVSRLEAVKNTDVSLLVVQEKPDDLSEDQYQDAIVNIFSRLNTQGRALSQEDITFAWIKAAWPSGHRVHGGVRQEFDELREELEELAVTITNDELVQAVALAWCVLDRDDVPGATLAKKDLVKGSVMRAVVNGVASRWSEAEDGIRAAIVWIASRLHDRGLDYGDQYLSYNALMTLWAWAAVADAWARHTLKGKLERSEFWKSLRDVLDRHVDRWLTLPSWAGVWSDGVERYTKELAAIWKGLVPVKDVPAALKALETFFDAAFDASTIKAAKDYIDRLDIDRRDRVRDYFIPLWFWTRLDPTRWNLASGQLRLEKSKAKQTLHVDHVIPYAWWESHPVDDEAEVDGNSLGNCMLLHANFNLAKSATPAATFLKAKVAEFKNDPPKLSSWAKALLVTEELLDATGRAETDVHAAVAVRTAAIRAELKEFIDGTRSRQDQ